jgi:hypothetical protein
MSISRFLWKTAFHGLEENGFSPALQQRADVDFNRKLAGFKPTPRLKGGACVFIRTLLRAEIHRFLNSLVHNKSGQKIIRRFKQYNQMIVIKETFIAKPGQASKLAKMFKDSMAGQSNVRIMTDVTGQFNRVVMETELENMQEAEKRMKDYQVDDSMREKMAGYTDMYMTGRREIYQIW